MICNEASRNESSILKWVRYPKLGITNNLMGKINPVGSFSFTPETLKDIRYKRCLCFMDIFQAQC